MTIYAVNYNIMALCTVGLTFDYAATALYKNKKKKNNSF